MSQFGLFAKSGEQQVNTGVKLHSGADDIASYTVKSKLIWLQAKLKFSHVNKKYKFQDLPSFQHCSYF